jgi:hypothetical protein
MRALAQMLRRRIASDRALVAIAAFFTSFQIVAAAPASLALAGLRAFAPGIEASKAEGAIWSGRLVGVRIDGVDLGDVAFSLKGLPLLIGRAEADLRFSGGAVDGPARISANLAGRMVVSRADLTFALGAAGRYAVLGAPLRGTARASIDRLELGSSGCREARAEIWTDALTAAAERLAAGPLDLAGEVHCAAGALVVDLEGEGVDGRVELTLTIAPDMTYGLSANARPVRREVADALQMFGFSPADGALTLAMTGALRTKG